jgi:hypothetical protein
VPGYAAKAFFKGPVVAQARRQARGVLHQGGASGEAATWQAHVAALAGNWPLAVCELPMPASRQQWQALTATPPQALLVRPDGFVAARLPATTTPAALAACLRQVLDRA